MSKDYELSDHAQKRMSARDISDKIIDLALKFGRRKYHGGKTLVLWKNYKLVLTNDDTKVLTAYKCGTNLREAFA